MFHEPFHYEGGLIRFAAQTVEHEHKQDIELALFSPILEKLEFVPVIGADLETGYTALLFSQQICPKKGLFDLGYHLAVWLTGKVQGYLVTLYRNSHLSAAAL